MYIHIYRVLSLFLSLSHFFYYQQCESLFISDASCSRIVVKIFKEDRKRNKKKSSSRQSAESRSCMDLASKRAPERGMKGCTIQKQRKREYKS